MVIATLTVFIWTYCNSLFSWPHYSLSSPNYGYCGCIRSLLVSLPWAGLSSWKGLLTSTSLFGIFALRDLNVFRDLNLDLIIDLIFMIRRSSISLCYSKFFSVLSWEWEVLLPTLQVPIFLDFLYFLSLLLSNWFISIQSSSLSYISLSNAPNNNKQTADFDVHTLFQNILQAN